MTGHGSRPTSLETGGGDVPLASGEGRRVLLVDDNPDIQTVLRGVYERAGFVPVVAPDGRTALRMLYDDPYDLVVLDLGLPGMDGLIVLERIREVTDLPVLVLTARGLEREKVTALTAGADDYLTKPFGNRELVARSLALLRRATPARSIGDDVIDDGTVRLDLARREAWVDDRRIDVTPTDWSLLLTFVQHPDHVLSAERLLELAWNDPFAVGPDRVKFAVLRLRKRAGWTDPDTAPLRSVRGFGYRYRPRSGAAR